jgi:Domain of unknown function (DUF5753)
LWHPYRDLVPSWFEIYLGLEHAATLIRSYDVQFVPGLLQTPGYARGLIQLSHSAAAQAQIRRQVELRMRRQEILRRPQPPHLWAVIDEAALRRPIAGRHVMNLLTFQAEPPEATPRSSTKSWPTAHSSRSLDAISGRHAYGLDAAISDAANLAPTHPSHRCWHRPLPPCTGYSDPGTLRTRTLPEYCVRQVDPRWRRRPAHVTERGCSVTVGR